MDHSCGLLNGQRDRGMEDFARQGLPSRKQERYKYAHVAEDFAPDYGLNLRRLIFKVDPYRAYRCSVPNMGTNLYYMINDIFYTSPFATPELPEGVFVGSLRTFALQHEELLADYYAKLARTEVDAITALNTAYAQDGLLVYVPAGVRVKPTLQVVNMVRGDVDILTHRRTLVIVGDEAEANLLFCDHTVDNGTFLNTNVSEVYVGKNSRVNWYALEETSASNRLYDNLYVSQEEGSHVEFATITLRNGTSRHRSDFILKGKGSDARIMGAVVAADEECVDHNLLVVHEGEACKSNVLYKYVLDGRSVGAFAGKVMVKPSGQHADSQETNANLCVSPTAHMYTQPMLEIYADDVKCNHGSTVGQLDQTALFYMAQRGISPEESRLLLQHAFVNEVIQQIQLVPLRERLSQMIEQRFRYGNNGCGNCSLCK